MNMTDEKKPAAPPPGQMKPGPQAVPPPEAVQLQDPVYPPGILPIYPAKMDPAFWAPAGDGSNIPNPPDPDPALKVRANVDEPFKPIAGTEK
jgi:hypothetical protein